MFAVLLVVNLLVLVGIGVAMALLVRRGREELSAFRGLLMTLAPRWPEAAVNACSRIPERRTMDAKSALDFFQRLHASPDWPVLAHRLQVDARAALLHCRTLADDGKGESALFHAGVAHYAAQLAVLPEREIQAALGLIKQEAAEAEMTARRAEWRGDNGRPARR